MNCVFVSTGQLRNVTDIVVSLFFKDPWNSAFNNKLTQHIPCILQAVFIMVRCFLFLTAQLCQSQSSENELAEPKSSVCMYSTTEQEVKNVDIEDEAP